MFNGEIMLFTVPGDVLLVPHSSLSADEKRFSPSTPQKSSDDHQSSAEGFERLFTTFDSSFLARLTGKNWSEIFLSLRERNTEPLDETTECLVRLLWM
jgi:hypothetical protein